VASHLRARRILVEVRLGAIVENARLYFLFRLHYFGIWLFFFATWLGTADQSCQRVLEIVIFFLCDRGQTASAHWLGLLLDRRIEWLYFFDTPLTSLILLTLFLFVIIPFDILRELGQTANLCGSSWCGNLSRLLLFLPFLLGHFECI
jgi:hypothetical protein